VVAIKSMRDYGNNRAEEKAMKTINTIQAEQLQRAEQYATEQLAERERILRAEQERNRAIIRISGIVKSDNKKR